MTAIFPPQGLKSRKTTIENHGWSLQTSNLSMTKRPIIRTIQAVYSFLFLKSKQKAKPIFIAKYAPN